MSLPRFPDKENIPTREEVINQIISSIAMEELGLSHIINAEGEKLQYALGTLEDIPGPDVPLTVEDLLKLNESVHNTLNSSMMNQFFLKEKLTQALSASVMSGPTGPASTIAVGNVKSVSYGQPLKIINSGTSTNAVFDFEIPEGRPGSFAESFGIHVELESTDAVQIQNSAPVMFNTLLNDSDSGISYDEVTGIFTFSKNGHFLVNWQISTDGTNPGENATFSLTVNGNNYATISSPSVTGQISGTAFIIVDNAPTTVSLINTSGSAITLIKSETKANMVISGINAKGGD